jgi:tetratricopeptide (TPR) repeat protein
MPPAAWDTFVGRAAELDVLDAALIRARGGEAALVLVGGEPGIGKSSLIDQFAGDARKRGASVVWGRCWEAGGAPAYWPWVQVIRAVARERDPDALRKLAGANAEELGQIIPEMHDPVRDQAKPSTTDPDTPRFRLFDAIASFLLRAAAARESTLLIALDDVHAADIPSLLLLQFLCRDLRDAHIMFVVGYRSTEMTREHPLTATLADLTRIPGARRINLEGLTPGEISEYLARVTGADVDSSVIDALEARTDGNPLFVSELVRLMLRDASATRAAVRFPEEIPEGVQEAIARRAAELSQSCRATLEMAAVLGRDFPLDVLQELARTDATDLLEALDEGVTAGMLLRTPGATGDFRFSHVLVRDALYDRLPAAMRARTHLRAAEIIEKLRARDMEPHLSEVAHHYIAAGPVADGATAANRAALAGEAAVRRLAYEEAVRLLESAVELAQRARALDDTRLDLLLELGDAQARAGDLGGAQATFRSAAVLARTRERPDALARAALGYGGRFAWCRAGTDPELIGLLEDALEAIGTDDSVHRVLLLSRLAGARRSEPDPTRRRREAKDALEIARRLNHPRALASALGGWHGAIWNADSPDERLILAQEMIDSATRADDTEELIISYCARWVARWELGQFAEAREDIETCIPIAARLQQPAQRWLVTIGQAAIALFVGRFDDVERFALAGRREGQGSLQFDAESAALTHLALLRLEQGRAAELLEDLERAADAYPWYAQLRALLAHLYAAEGQVDRARAELERIAASDYLAARMAENYETFTYSVLADVVREIGDPSLAVPLFERLAPYAQRNAMAPPEASVGWIARPLGVLCTVLGRRNDAMAYFEEALQAHREMGAHPWLARTHYDYARLLRDTDAQRADEHLRQAALIAQRLNMSGLCSRMAMPEERVSDRSECVFRREGEYWTIGFAGRSIRLKHSKGLLYLAALLAQPGHEIPAVDLANLADGSVRGDNGGNVLDARARDQYRRRIETLQGEIDEADEWADSERASRSRAELEFLVHELAAATGLGGRDRTFGSSAERARQRVKKAIATTLARIDAQHPELGRHLTATIRTGYGCRYEPDPRASTVWKT